MDTVIGFLAGLFVGVSGTSTVMVWFAYAALAKKNREGGE